MKRTSLTMGAAIAALVAGSAGAQDLITPIGEGDYTWDGFQEFADTYDLSGQTLTMTGS
jgi:alpha-glucoside transport system substrate-binding protein